MTFKLDGRPLIADYDEDEDILYLWVDDRRSAVSYETEQGHLVQLDADTREFIGVTVIDFRTRWEGKEIAFDVPQFKHRVLQPA
jgi:hypothetical protein